MLSCHESEVIASADAQAMVSATTLACASG
jgi:hypothetical protein